MANPTLESAVIEIIESYLQHLDGEAEPSDIHNLIIRDVEASLIRHILTRTNNNQSQAARWLGITRNTLKNKMLAYGLAEPTPPKPTPRKGRRR